MTKNILPVSIGNALVNDAVRRVPDQEPDRQALRALCAETLHFENHFLTIYKGYLLAELQGGDETAQHRALWMLDQIAYQDEDIQRAMQALKP